MIGIDRADAFRFETLEPAADGLPRQEWHHFIVHGDQARVIVNFSIGDRMEPPGPLARLVVLVHHDHDWSGWVDEYEYSGVDVGSGGLFARYGENTLEYHDGGYDLNIRMRDLKVHGRLRFEPAATSLVKNNQPLGAGRFNWLFIPRLIADGHLWAGGTRFSMREAVAYHDHNWGRFSWEDDFGWQWGSAVSSHRDDPWSLVFWRMTDRGHLTTRGQGLALWDGNEPVVMFRDRFIQVETEGVLRRPPRVWLPGVRSITHPGSASDLPERLLVRASRGDDEVGVAVTVRDYGRIVVTPGGSGREPILHEVDASVDLWGRFGGRVIEKEGTGVFEFLH